MTDAVCSPSEGSKGAGEILLQKWRDRITARQSARLWIVSVSSIRESGLTTPQCSALGG